MLKRLLTTEVGWRATRIGVRWIVALSVCGVFANFVGLALGYAGVLELPAAMAGLLGVLLAPTLVGLLIVGTSGLADLPERQRRRMMYAGWPPWLRRLVYGLIVFGGVNFIGRFVLETTGVVPVLQEGFPSVTASSFSLMVFAAAVGQMHSFLVLRARLDASRCANGHPVPLEARYCPACGEALSPPA